MSWLFEKSGKGEMLTPLAQQLRCRASMANSALEYGAFAAVLTNIGVSEAYIKSDQFHPRASDGPL